VSDYLVDDFVPGPSSLTPLVFGVFGFKSTRFAPFAVVEGAAVGLPLINLFQVSGDAEFSLESATFFKSTSFPNNP